MDDRLTQAAQSTFAPATALHALRALLDPSPLSAQTLASCSDVFLRNLAVVLIVSPPMLDSLRAHPEWLGWLEQRVEAYQPEVPDITRYEEAWKARGSEEVIFEDRMEWLRGFKRREYLDIIYRDLAGLASFEETVRRLSVLADWVIEKTLSHCGGLLAAETAPGHRLPAWPEGFAVMAMGKLGGRELNYSSDIDLIFCRRDSDDHEDLRFFTRLGERLVQALSRPGLEGFLYRVDMRLRPHGASGPLVPTVASLVNYYESWGEAWERQALIKARHVAGSGELGGRVMDFAARFTFARQMDDSSLEEVKRVKHRSEKEYALEEDRIHLKQGPGGIRDIEFYVQYLQLIAGSQRPQVRSGSTLEAIRRLREGRVLLEGEESQLSLAYLFLRIVEHRLQLKALTPDAIIPKDVHEVTILAQGLDFGADESSSRENFLRVLASYRVRVRGILERIYLTPGYLRLKEQEEEFAQLLSDRAPRGRVEEILKCFGFQDTEKAWQNIRSLGLGPAGRLLPPGDRRAFLECVFPMLETLRNSVDPDLALDHLESFSSATGNRVSFIRALTSRRPHLARLSNLLAVSNLCHRILTHHPEYFDSMARGIHLHEGRDWLDMYEDLNERADASPGVEQRDIVLRKFRQRETVRVAYRDLAGLGGALEISRELSAVAEACMQAAAVWTRPASAGVQDSLCVVALGKLGSRQMHYASDLDLMFLYESPSVESSAESRAQLQLQQDGRIETILEIVSGVTSEGVAYPMDLRLRPEGSSGLLARSWESFMDHARRYMQPWERMALIRSRILDHRDEIARRWDGVLSEVVYEFDWNEEAFKEIRHLKRRIENEKSKESRSHLDFKYGKGGVADLEFLVQYLQIRYGKEQPAVRSPGVSAALPALCQAGALSAAERDELQAAHAFQRRVENRYQLMEEWPLREVSRESPMLVRLARSLGYQGDTPAAARRSFLADWDAMASGVRSLVDRYFYSS